MPLKLRALLSSTWEQNLLHMSETNRALTRKPDTIGLLEAQIIFYLSKIYYSFGMIIITSNVQNCIIDVCIVL